MSDFLPEGYSVPSTSNYMKLGVGKNKFRILSSAIIGNEYWTTTPEGRKPVRKRMSETISMQDVEDDIKHFWAFTVWNYQDKRIQILELTQKGLQKAIKAIVEDEDWGDPKNYDITITGTGDGMERRYTIMPVAPKPLDAEIKKKAKETVVNLEALYDGDDPFSPDSTQIATDADNAMF